MVGHLTVLKDIKNPTFCAGMLTVALREGPLPSPHPLCGSPWAVSFVVLDTPGVHGAEEGTHDCLSIKLFCKDEE